MGPSHRLQLFTNCPSVGPSHGMQSFRNRLLQHGSPTGSQALPANLLRRGLLSPWRHRSWQELAPVWSPHGVTASLGHIHLLWRGVPSMACRWRSAPPWTSMGCRGTTCLTMVFIIGCRAISAPVPGASPPPPSSLTLVSAELFLSHILTVLSHCRVFFCFLNLLSLRRYHHCWWAWPWPAAGPSWSRLALALSDTRQMHAAASGSFSQNYPCSPPATKTLACKSSIPEYFSTLSSCYIVFNFFISILNSY